MQETSHDKSRSNVSNFHGELGLYINIELANLLVKVSDNFMTKIDKIKQVQTQISTHHS